MKPKKDIKNWMLNLEKSIGTPIVLTLSVDQGRITFCSCVDKRMYLGDEPEESSRGVDLTKRVKTVRPYELYIG